MQTSRLIVVGVLYPLLRHFGYGLDFKEAMILVWSGLRGAVALSLSLSVKVSFEREYSSGNNIDYVEAKLVYIYMEGWPWVWETIPTEGDPFLIHIHLHIPWRRRTARDAGAACYP